MTPPIIKYLRYLMEHPEVTPSDDEYVTFGGTKNPDANDEVYKALNNKLNSNTVTDQKVEYSIIKEMAGITGNWHRDIAILVRLYCCNPETVKDIKHDPNLSKDEKRIKLISMIIEEHDRGFKYGDVCTCENSPWCGGHHHEDEGIDNE